MKINPHAAQMAHTAHSKQPPAQAARELIAAQAELADSPFGQLVSRIARGESLEPASQTESQT